MKVLKNSRAMFSIALLCFGFSAARAYDPNKPWIYSMRFMMDTWGYLEMYSTATVVSKPSNFAAFRVVTSTTDPTYQLLVTTQGNVGIGTGAPVSLLDVNGTAQLRGSSGGTGLYVNSSGNVGAGTTAPEQKLDVNGYVKTTGINSGSSYIVLANGATGTCFTVPSGSQGMYLIYSKQDTSWNGAIRGYALISAGTTSIAMDILVNQDGCVYSVNGMDVQITNNAGGICGFRTWWIRLAY